jgi:hypothetical protein
VDRGAAHDPSILLTWNLRAFGRNPRRRKSVGHPKDLRTNRPSRYAIKSNTNEHSNVDSDNTVANFCLHSSRHRRTDTDSFHQPDHSAPTSVFENSMALYRHRPRRVGVGLPDICEMETEGRDCWATRVLCAFGLGRSADAAEKFVDQLRVIFSFQSIRRPRQPSD